MNAPKLIFKTHRHPNIQKKLIKKLEDQGCEIEFIPLPEHTYPKDMFEFEEDIAWVENQIEQGNQAAWFCAKVTVRLGELEADNYLGCCSYKSFEEFTDTYVSDYYADMIAECVHELNEKLEHETSGVPMAIL